MALTKPCNATRERSVVPPRLQGQKPHANLKSRSCAAVDRHRPLTATRMPIQTSFMANIKRCRSTLEASLDGYADPNVRVEAADPWLTLGGLS